MSNLLRVANFKPNTNDQSHTKKWLYEKASRSKCKHKIVTETMCCMFANIKHQTLSRNCTFHHFSTYKFSATSTSHRKGARGCVCLRARHSILMKVSQTEIVWKLEARAKTRGAFAKMSFRQNDSSLCRARNRGDTESYLRLIIKLQTFIGNVKSFPILSENLFFGLITFFL